jgi:SAM-dependent methyltransferase
VRTDYDQLAARYDEDRAQWAISRDDVIEELRASHPTVRALDVGCGTGRWLAAQRELFDARVTLVGADPSAAMVGEARAKGILSVTLARAEELPFDDASFDYVVCSYVFHHVGDKDHALDEVTRILTPDGVFRINNIEPSVGHGWWVYEFFPEAIAVDTARFWLPSRIGDALEARGFTVDIEINSSTQAAPASQVLADAERRVVSQLALLDDDAYARGLAHLRRAAAPVGATVATTDARLCLTARRGECTP